LTTKEISIFKPLGQMNGNLVGSIYGRSSIKIAHFIPMRLQTWTPQTILDSDWFLVHLAKRFQSRRFLKIGQSETRIACGGHVC
jgi:hypothetical protein